MPRRDHEGAQELIPIGPRLTAVAMATVLLSVTACRNDLEEVADFETLDHGPAQSIEGADMQYSEDGVPTHRLVAAFMERAAEEEAKHVARPKSRVALRATSFAVAVAQNGYLDSNSNVAPAQQRNCCCQLINTLLYTTTPLAILIIRGKRVSN